MRELLNLEQFPDLFFLSSLLPLLICFARNSPFVNKWHVTETLPILSTMICLLIVNKGPRRFECVVRV